MANLNTKIPTFKPAKDIELKWDNFRKGLNILLKETEVAGNELVQADNLMLVGKGVPTRRWGTDLYFLSAATGSVRGLKGLYQSDGTDQLLALTDQGILTVKSGASYSSLTGASWASGYDAYMAQQNNAMYIVNGQREMVRYSNPTLYSFPTISIPTNTFATQISGVSGTNAYAYRVSAKSTVGETPASAYYQVSNQPQDLTMGSLKVSWSAVSTASGVLQGYNVYGRNLGDERFLGSVGATSTSFIDDGSAIPLELTYPPLADSTGGVVAKYVKRFEDRLIFAGIDGDPSKVMITGRVPFHEKFDLASGGNFIRIEPDAGDDVTGIDIFENKIIVFKERSIWQVTLSSKAIGNYFVTIPTAQLITASHGCIAPKSIQAVENDLFFLSRNGVYSLGYEPNILNVIRTNEISARIRPFFDNLSYSQKTMATAAYYGYKYVLSFPGKDKTMTYDRERMAWMGPWTRDSNVFEVYYDSDGNQKFLYGADDSPNVYEYSSNFDNDDGTAIATQLRTKKDDFGDWARFKNIKEVFTLFRNVQGTVNVDVRIQQRDGQVTTSKSFNVSTTSSSSGWGSSQWGDHQWADSEEHGGASDVNEIYRWLSLNKAARNIQLIIKTTNANDQYEFLSATIRAKPLGMGFLPSSEKV